MGFARVIFAMTRCAKIARARRGGGWRRRVRGGGLRDGGDKPRSIERLARWASAVRGAGHRAQDRRGRLQRDGDRCGLALRRWGERHGLYARVTGYVTALDERCGFARSSRQRIPRQGADQGSPEGTGDWPRLLEEQAR